MSQTGKEVKRDQITINAPAKVNLGLEVLRRRADRYHDLNTVFAEVDLYDRLTLTPGRPGEVVCHVVGDQRLASEPAEDNLCSRAARMLLEEGGVNHGLRIDLLKRIPIGAGLGGGSSDAAATLRGVAALFGLNIDAERLRELALQLGSDVPFFIDGGVALAGGQGDELHQLDIRLPWHILLVNPGVHVPTPEAFGLVGRRDEIKGGDLVSILEEGVRDPSRLRGRLQNHFERPIFERWPTIAELYGKLSATDGVLYVGMSGSGSTIFGLFGDRGMAVRGEANFPEFFTHVGRLGSVV